MKQASWIPTVTLTGVSGAATAQALGSRMLTEVTSSFAPKEFV